MGLFSSLFGTKQKTKVSIPSWLRAPLQGYTKQISGFLDTDPAKLVAPASELQKSAFDQTKDLGSWKAPLDSATSAIQAAGAAAPASAGNAASASLLQTGPAQQAGVTTYNAPQLGPANQAGQVNIAPIQQMDSASLLDNLNSYLDPSLEALVDSTMADYDRSTAEQRAAQQARLAGAGAFGSGGQFYMSNFDIANAVRGAALNNQLRSQAWNSALNASNMDADRRQGASAFNAGAANTRGLQQGQMDLQLGMFNTDALNNFLLSQAGFDAQAGQFNANAANQASMFNADQSNNMSMFNTGQANQMGMFNTGQANDMAQYNAGLQNAGLDRSLQAAGMQGDLANDYGQNQRADLALTGTMGEMQRSIDQAYASAPMSQLLAGAQMFSPLMGLTGQTTTSTPSPFNVGLSIASLFSDERTKTSIRKIAEMPDGLGIYEYEYLHMPGTKWVRTMADDVERIRPWALGPELGGYKTVNYALLEA